MADLADMAGKEIAPPDQSPRRNLLVASLAVGIGAIVSIFPFAAGLGVLFDPLRRKTAKAEALRITTLDALPDDGVPRAFPVINTRVDAWNLYPAEAIGSVFLKRDPGQQLPVAWTTVCPHLGCAVDFKAPASQFQCPCHTSGFNTNGDILFGPSPRCLDSLEVEVRNDDEIWVKYEKFRSGTEAKTPEE
jgi:menaquinol-cytochrome c reductase iron-sulfur subunit